jgi:nuclear pore complex protein Nup93
VLLVQTTFEDVFPVEATRVEEYLQQVHEMVMLSAIQEASRDNLRSFGDYMLKVSEDNWQKEKLEFLNSLSRLPYAPSANGVGSTPSAGAIQAYRGPATVATPSRMLQDGRGLESSSTQLSMVERKAAAYANVVIRLNEARERSLPFKVRLSVR